MTDTRQQKMRAGTVLVAAALFSITLIGFLRTPLLPSIGRDLGLGAFGLSALVAAFGLGRVIVDLPAGRATDRYSIGTIMSVAAITVAAGSFVWAVAPNTALLLVGAMFLGIGSSLATSSGVAFFASAPRASRGTSVSMYGAALLTAQSFGPLIAGLATLLFDWRIVLALGGGAALAIAGAVFTRAQGIETAGREATRAGRSEETDVARSTLWVLYALPAAQFGIGAAVIQTLIPFLGEEDLGLSTATVGVALGVGGGLRLVAAMVSGRIADRLGRKVALVPGLTLQLLGLIVFVADLGAVGWWVSIALLTIGSAAANIAGTIIADLSEGGPLGRRLGRFRLVGDLSLMLTPLATGWLFSRHGLEISVSFLIVFAGAVLVGATRLPETLRD
ncbi:MAG: MFS transporter [Acidimicrobiales bacterium]